MKVIVSEPSGAEVREHKELLHQRPFQGDGSQSLTAAYVQDSPFSSTHLDTGFPLRTLENFPLRALKVLQL